MKRGVVNILAAYGGLVLLLQISAATVGHFTNRRLAGVVMGQPNRHLANATVLFDDRSGEIRKVLTNERGEFRFSVEPSRLARARLLICGSGFLPMYTDEQSLNNLTANQYTLGERTKPDFPFSAAAFLGWQGNVPPDCPPSSMRHNTR